MWSSVVWSLVRRRVTRRLTRLQTMYNGLMYRKILGNVALRLRCDCVYFFKLLKTSTVRLATPIKRTFWVPVLIIYSILTQLTGHAYRGVHACTVSCDNKHKRWAWMLMMCTLFNAPDRICLYTVFIRLVLLIHEKMFALQSFPFLFFLNNVAGVWNNLATNPK